MSKLEMDMELLPTQEEFVFSTSVFPAFVGGFGSGKTEALVNRSILGKLKYPAQDRAYFAPTYSLLELTAFPRFEAMCDKYKIRAKINTSKKVMTFRGAGKIIFKTMENPERIIGFEVADVDIDELDTLPAKKAELVFQKAMARARQTKPDKSPNTTSVGTTPEGYRFVYEQWHQNKDQRYKIYRAKTSENYMIGPGYIENLRSLYPPQLLAAYLDGDFVNMQSGSVYPEFNRVLNGSAATIQKGEPLHVGVDFNVMNMTAIVCVLRDGWPVAVAEHLRLRDTETMARYLHETYPGHSLTAYPDATGSQRQHANVGTSDIAILAAKGLRVSVNGTNGPVRDRVNAVNAMILNAAGERRFKINVDRCPQLTANLEKQAFDQNGMPEKGTGTTGTDHTNDALGYYLNYVWPIVKPAAGVFKIGFAN